MKKNVKTLMTAAMFAVAMGTLPTGTAETANADYSPSGEASGNVYGFSPVTTIAETTIPQPVYGPAPYWTTAPVDTDYDPQQTETTFAAVYGPPVSQVTTSVEDYNPKQTETTFVAVYGPPVSQVTTSVEDYNPKQTETTFAAVYGPAPFWTTTMPTETMTVPTVPVYGPPIAWKGDLDSDNRIDVFDMIEMRKKYFEAVMYGDYDYRADVNDDGEVNVADMVMLQKYILGEIKDFRSTVPDYNSSTTTTTVVQENNEEN